MGSEAPATLEEALAERRALQARVAELAGALRHKDEFLAAMSHELRTPLNAVLGLTDALLEGLAGELGPTQRSWIADINASGTHLLGLINELLDLARIEAGRFEPDWQSASPAHLAEGAVRLVLGNAIAKAISIHTDAPADLPAIVTDIRAARQALLNVLGNAVKFTPNGRTVRVVVRAGAVAGTASFDVIDEGVGIAPDRLTEVFEPYVQLDAVGAPRHGGTGLGLALAARMARALGGDISVTSTPGVGSTFRIVLGRPDGHGAEPTHGADALGETLGAAEDAAVYLRPGTRVLVADDDARNREMLSAYLRAKGFVVEVAIDGQEALDRASAWRPDLVLLDVQMPAMDGLEVTRRLRAHAEPELARLPIVTITALAMPGDRDRCLSAGADAYLAKPVRMPEVLRVMTELLTAAR